MTLTLTAKKTSKIKEKSDGGVQSINRALTILDVLAEWDEGMTLTELAKAAGLPPSSAHRILTTLQRQRFVRFDTSSMSWLVGVHAFVVGNSFARSRDVVSLATPHMRRLMNKTGETVNFLMFESEQVVCMAQIQSQQAIRAISRPGGCMEMHRSAGGKAILAHMSRTDVTDLLKRKGMTRYTEHTLTTPEALFGEIETIKTNGYSVDNEEFTPGLRCIAAAIFDENGKPTAAISIAGPASRIKDGRIDMLGQTVAQFAASVTQEIGGEYP